MPDNSSAAPLKWAEIWKLFDADEQQRACLDLVETINADPEDKVALGVVDRLAQATKTRPASLRAQLKSSPEKAATAIRTRAPALLEPTSWRLLFFAYFSRRKSALLRAFLDGLGIEHYDGLVKGPFEPPAEATVRAATEGLLRTFSQREVARYLAVLVRSGSEWEFVLPERDRLLQLLEVEKRDGGESVAAQTDAASASSMEFNVLDRVLIEQVVRAAMEIEGAIDALQVEELIEFVVRLNEKWVRSYFHLGFMDVLLPGRQWRFDHQGGNKARRGWYLAGVIAGLVRSNDLAGLNRVLDERSADVHAALRESGGPGASIARTAFRQIAEAGRSADALAVVRGQIRHVGDTLAEEALAVAAALIRQSHFEQAKVIVDELMRQLPAVDKGAPPTDYRLDLSRRRAQCLQAAGDFDGAERDYRSLLDAGEDINSPDLLADLGLVKGRFRSIAEVRLPHDPAARAAMRDSLARGESYFDRALARWGDAAPKAAYGVAVLAYLRWSFADDRDREERRERAANLAAAAVDAMLKSEFAGVFREYGALGQAQFALAVTRLNSFEDVQGREALAAWQAITPEAGRFPNQDFAYLVGALDAYGADIADPIAESIWENRRDDALQILGRGSWMTRSPRLRAAVVSAARLELAPRSERFQLWLSLVPVLLRVGDVATAEEGLGELEQLAETPEDAERLLGFLGERSNYDPAWTEFEASLARVYLMRRVGRDLDCSQALRQLFYKVRDANRWAAEQILVTLEEWQLDGELSSELQRALPSTEAKGGEDVDERLRGGAAVRLVFIGGNEIQARYDDAVAEELSEQWPGVDVHFEHSGWSSNWGRDLGRLTELANAADAVVLMPMMRTNLGRRLRESLTKPWLSCTSTGKAGMLLSLRQAARLVIGLRHGQRTPR